MVLDGLPLEDCRTPRLRPSTCWALAPRCLVWSSGLPGDTGRELRFVDLLGGTKPHLLTSVVNNLGGETTLEYASSTRFSLADRRAGRPWATRLPFPVHVVIRRETSPTW